MSQSMKVVMWITGVATVIAGLSFVFIQATSVEIQQWSTDGPAAANNFATIGLGVLLIPLGFVCTFIALAGWPTLAILTVLHCLRPGPRATVWEQLETAKILDQIELERQWEELRAGGALEKIRHDRARINPPGGGLTFPPRN